jgi:hypothetical protein
MMFWPVTNMVASLIVAAILVYKLGWKACSFTPIERFGMAAIGAGCIMTIGPLMSVHPTPFEDWAATLLRIGCAVYFVGRLTRHRYNNWSARRRARLHFEHRERHSHPG